MGGTWEDRKISPIRKRNQRVWEQVIQWNFTFIEYLKKIQSDWTFFRHFPSSTWTLFGPLFITLPQTSSYSTWKTKLLSTSSHFKKHLLNWKYRKSWHKFLSQFSSEWPTFVRVKKYRISWQSTRNGSQYLGRVGKTTPHFTTTQKVSGKLARKSVPKCNNWPVECWAVRVVKIRDHLQLDKLRGRSNWRWYFTCPL